jgi:hypothetical protein
MPVSVADVISKLSVIATVQISTVWDEEGERMNFTIFTIVPQLTWHILFGENHHDSNKALIGHADPASSSDTPACNA